MNIFAASIDIAATAATEINKCVALVVLREDDSFAKVKILPRSKVQEAIAEANKLYNPHFHTFILCNLSPMAQIVMAQKEVFEDITGCDMFVPPREGNA